MSKRVKRETVDLTAPDRPSTPTNHAAENERLHKEVAHKNEMITSLEEFLGKMQRGVCCGVCTELLYQPFNLSCGHVFCYSCLVDWFKQTKQCPTCRKRVLEKPAVSYLIKEMVNSIVRRSELVDPESQGSRFHREQADADKLVRDHANDLFPGLFHTRVIHGNRLRDEEDNVLRCVRCNWEVEGPTCVHCGLAFSDDDSDGELDDGESLSEESDEDEDEDDEYDDSFVVPDEEFYDNPLLAQIDWTAHYPFQDDVEFSDEEDEDMDDEEDSEASTEDDDEDDDEDEDEFEEAHEHLPAPTAMVDVDDGDDTIPYYTREDNYYNPPEDTSEQDDDEDDLPPRRASQRSHVQPPANPPRPALPAPANQPSRTWQPMPETAIAMNRGDSRQPILIDLDRSPPPRQTARRGIPSRRVQSSRRGRPHVIESDSD